MKNACVRECTFDEDNTIGWDYNHGWDYPLDSSGKFSGFEKVQKDIFTSIDKIKAI